MRICLSEVARCQEVSPRPNFVVLLGDRYGWRPLPEVVDAEEFETVTARLAPEDAAVAAAAYDRDDNAVDPEYVLGRTQRARPPTTPTPCAGARRGREQRRPRRTPSSRSTRCQPPSWRS